MASTRVSIVARTVVVAGGLVSVFLTPSFALAHFDAFADKVAPGWLTAVAWPRFFEGGTAADDYRANGIAWGLALAVAAIALIVLVRALPLTLPRIRRGWMVLATGFGAVAVGTFAEYTITDAALHPGYGFVVELIGFALIAAATVVIGVAARRELSLDMPTTLALAILGALALATGAIFLAHVPSGPALVPLVGLVIAVLSGHPNDGDVRARSV